jgi:hypothetical protein
MQRNFTTLLVTKRPLKYIFFIFLAVSLYASKVVRNLEKGQKNIFQVEKIEKKIYIILLQVV